MPSDWSGRFGRMTTSTNEQTFTLHGQSLTACIIFRLGTEQFTEKLEEVNRVLAGIETVKNRTRQQSAYIKGMLDRVRGLRNTSDDFASEIRNAKLATSKTRDVRVRIFVHDLTLVFS